MDSLVRRLVKSINTHQHQAKNSSATLWDAGVTNEPAVEDLSKDKDQL
jgi:hypothetical protein